MGRHGIPDTAGLQFGHAHGKLAGLDNGRMDKLVDGALVALGHAAKRTLCRLSDSDEAGLIAGMGRCGHHVELCRCIGVVTGKQHFLCAHGDIQAVLIAQRILHAIHGYGACAAHVEHAQLAALQEEVHAEVGPHVHALFNAHSLSHRHCTQGDHAVNMAVHILQFVLHKKLFYKKFIAHLRGGHALEMHRIHRITLVHSKHAPIFF